MGEQWFPAIKKLFRLTLIFTCLLLKGAKGNHGQFEVLFKVFIPECEQEKEKKSNEKEKKNGHKSDN